jgi:transcriptional regulator with XRE-family HTH domain
MIIWAHMKKIKVPETTQPKTRSKLGEFLRESRKRAGYSQVEFATKLGYESPQFISDWERGVYSPPMKKFLLICDLLFIKPEKLFQLLLDFSIQRLVEDMNSEFQALRKNKKK